MAFLHLNSSPTRNIAQYDPISPGFLCFQADKVQRACIRLRRGLYRRPRGERHARFVKEETERIDSRFLEPACGNGNFLARILQRKLAVVQRRYAAVRADYELYAFLTVSSLYGIELLQDNVDECRTRLFHILRDAYLAHFPQADDKGDYLQSIRYVFHRNILWGDALTLRTPDGREAITFSEWTAVNGNGLIKRRDFELDMLLRNQPMQGPNLFSDLGDEAFIPMPKAEYPLTHYLKIYTQDAAQL